MFIIEKCKREEYIKAWNYMYLLDKKKYNTNEMFDDVNPSLNKKPLRTETDNFATVVYDSTIPTEGFEHGRPVGVFSFVITPRKNIGKQFLVDPDYQGKGLGRAILLVNEKQLFENGFNTYYIGCSKMSAGIYKKHLGIEPYSSDVEHDMFKFNVDLDEEHFKTHYKRIIEDRTDIKVV